MNNFLNSLASFGNRIAAPVKDLANIPEQADAIAERMYPNSARDASTKNAFRHALGTGMLAQYMGASSMHPDSFRGAAVSNLAKLAGYGWEGMGGIKNLTNPSVDTLHDFNANAIGAKAAIGVDQAELIRKLQGYANSSRQQMPPGIFADSPGYMTRSVR